MLSDSELDLIKGRMEAHYVFTDPETGVWIDGGGGQLEDLKTLVAEVERLRVDYEDVVAGWDRELESVRELEADRVLFVENCKHSGRDALIVQRNEGIRWVTCTDCGADFTRSEFYEDMKADRDRLVDVISTHRVETLTYREGPPSMQDVELWAALDQEDDTFPSRCECGRVVPCRHCDQKEQR